MILDSVHLADAGPPIGKTQKPSLHLVFQGNDIRAWINSVSIRELREKYQFLVEFRQFPYLDDLYQSKSLDAFNDFLVDWMENEQTNSVYTHFMFRLHSTDIEELDDVGFMEWLYYTLLICKGTRVNIILIVDGKDFTKNSAPIACSITRDFSDPRLNIAISGAFEKCVLIPEDLGIYTIALIGNKAECDQVQTAIGTNEQRFVVAKRK